MGLLCFGTCSRSLPSQLTTSRRNLVFGFLLFKKQGKLPPITPLRELFKLNIYYVFCLRLTIT